jgi:uncharacterized protein YndB with AHSA1/START domain
VPQLFPCERIGLEIFDDAPFRSRDTIDLTISSHQVWEVLTDVETLPQWHRLITKATWVSPAPHRVGSIRALEVIAGMAATEEVIVWNPHHHLAFRIIESSRQATGASAEEFRIETTERGCKVTWSTARRPRKPPSWLFQMYARPVIKRVTRRDSRRLRKYIERRCSPTIQYTG